MAAGSSPISVVGNTAPNCMAAILAARRRTCPPTWLLGSVGGDGLLGGGVASCRRARRGGGATRSAQRGGGVAVPDQEGRCRADDCHDGGGEEGVVETAELGRLLGGGAD